MLSDWTRAYLRDARDSGAIDRDVPDEVIAREAARLDVLIFQLASSFVDNDFNERDERDPVTKDQSKHRDASGVLRYSADGSEVFPGPTGVRRPAIEQIIDDNTKRRRHE